jgi:hypothetical protein
MRKVLHSAGANIIDMQLAKTGADTVETSRQSIPDFLTWSWIAIFSSRAASIAIECGNEPEEFWPCRFQTNPDEASFLHLPMKAFDIVDVVRSTFKVILPLDPPIPMFIERLVTKPLPDFLPPCFRAKQGMTAQVFSELFVRDDFRLAWQRNSFVGADFRLLSNSAFPAEGQNGTAV